VYSLVGKASRREENMNSIGPLIQLGSRVLQVDNHLKKISNPFPIAAWLEHREVANSAT
jgi:hypothetical protein